ncbi:MAG TPA: Hpt domain-containing protein [Pseudomonadales bacterium]|nr:Hpt domain-containing protein [Pseudomonadales bacterium]
MQDEILASQTVPEWQRLDHLADALTSIDYFLERMLEDRVIPDPRMLEIAEESIAELQAGGTAAVPGADADPNETLVRPAADVAPGARPDDGPSAEFAGDDLDADDLEFGEDAPAGAARDARGAPLDDGPSALSEPAEDDFDLGGDEPEAAQAAHGAPLDDGPSALSEPVEDDFDLGEDAPAVPRDARGAPLDDGPSALSEPAEDDFDLGGDEPEAVQAAHGAPLDDGPSALSKPVEDDFDMGGFELDEETPAAAPEARGAPQDDGPSLLSEPTEGDFDLGLDDDADTPAAPASSGALADDAELIDDEIIEIFLEEVTEVLEQIDASADAWRRNPRDATALTEIRRAYHTLKGSGRMVGASVLGELAWSVENMLNRVIDDTIEPSPAVVALTLQVRDIVPVLRQAFADRQVPELDVSPYMERADVLASGGSAEDLDDLPTEPAGRTPAPAATESAPRRVSSEDAPSDLSDPTEDDFDLGGVEFDLGADDDSTAAPPLPEVSAEDRDPSLLEIFDEEASEHLQTARAFVERARTRGVPPPLSDDLRRALHTLKGSAAMADFPGVSQLAAPLESLVRAYLELQLPVNDKFLDLLDAGLHRIEVGLEHLRQSGEERVYDSAEKDYLQRVGELLERLDADSRARYSGQSQGVPTAGIFSSEGIDLLLDAGAILRDWAAGAMESKRDELLAELRAVDRRAREAGQESIAELAAALAAAHEKIGPRLPATAQAPLERGHESLVGMLDALAAGLEIPAAADDIADLSSLTAADAAPAATGAEAEGAGAETESVAGLDLDPEMVEIFFEEADELLEAIEASIEGWPAGDGTAADELLRCLHTLKGGARMAGLSGLGAEAHDLETWIEHNRADAGAAFFTELRRRADVMAERIAELRRGGSIALHVSGDAGSAPAADEPVPEATRPAAEAAPAPAPAEPVAAAAPAPVPGGGDDLEDADPEILELFLEEAGELVELLDGSLAAWRREPANEIHLEGLLRALHTLKGGARMAGMMAFGEAAHDLETRLIDQRGVGEPDADFFATVQSRADALSERVAALAAGDRSAPTETIEMAPPPASDAAPEAAADAVASDAVAQDAVARDLAEPDVVMPGTFELPDVPEPEAGAAAPPAAPAAVPASREAPPVAMDPSDAKGDGQTKEAQQEMIRVSSGLLDDLVSLAGETSIMRGRVQQEVTDFAVALDEMEATIERIQEQVRRLDNAAQEQILFRQESAKSAGDSDDFDPLEMDRYTQLQELTRTLAESASDVNDLRETLLERVRTTDTLLLQQARINTELQEGLMRTRMVPFARLLPRLKRIVRQVGRELGKPVELEVENAEGELDRNVLERMIAPLEHMLRNAVDHGLEKPEVRTERGKPAQGTIRLKLSQEGGQILIQVADDGGGINAAGVRAKAVERGLLAADAEPTQEEILAFIMSPGFSTAKSVTQISGRGVGMDVVNSEVKQLGGNISIASALGEGTSFTVRLPFTVSVSRALMVSLDGNTYAVPLTGIEGIVRVSPVQLQRRYEGGSTNFAYGGRTYELSYLGEWLGRPRQIKQDAQSVPVLMVRAGDQARAVHVDAVSGSREIVVKSLGPQFAQVAGVSGATILGDGSVVVILDLPSLLRGSSRIELTGAADAEEPRSRKRHVMVVDDSVTVRKVTTRLLERKGFEVTVAKDGVEAVAMLAEMKPDVMLLDIEMPRMDGFEVATHVRNDARLADLPIIMISSRTGDKHRERAEGIGVDRFLGKPFQEAELLSTIEDLATS